MSDSLRPCGLYPSGSPVCGIFQERILECVATSYSRECSQPGTEPMSLALVSDYFLRLEVKDVIKQFMYV